MAMRKNRNADAKSEALHLEILLGMFSSVTVAKRRVILFLHNRKAFTVLISNTVWHGSGIFRHEPTGSGDSASFIRLACRAIRKTQTVGRFITLSLRRASAAPFYFFTF